MIFLMINISLISSLLVVFVLLLLVIPRIFYILTLQSTFNAISIGNRKMPSNNVWLLLIPIFGIIWQFIVVKKLSDSIRTEANLRGIRISELQPGYGVGQAMCILECFFFIPFINFFTGVAGFICWILYWIKINEYKKILLAEDLMLFGELV